LTSIERLTGRYEHRAADESNTLGLRIALEEIKEFKKEDQ
jgi:hypothetical protein